MNFIVKPIQSYLWIANLLLQKPRLLILCIKPWIYGAICWALLFFASFSLKDKIEASFLPLIPAWIIGYVAPFIIPVLFLLSGICALLFALILNEFIIDTFILKTASETDPVIDTKIVKRGSLKQGADCLVRLLITLPLSLVCLVIGLIPIVNGLSIVLSSLLVGYAIVDCPLCILGRGIGARFTFIFKNILSVLLLGFLFSPTFLIPGLSILLLPIAYGAATRFVLAHA